MLSSPRPPYSRSRGTAPDEVLSSCILIIWFQISETPLTNLEENQGYVLCRHQDIKLVLFLYFRIEFLARFILLLLLLLFLCYIEEKKTKDEPCKKFNFGVWK